jgi:hypothetical protein
MAFMDRGAFAQVPTNVSLAAGYEPHALAERFLSAVDQTFARVRDRRDNNGADRRHELFRSRDHITPDGIRLFRITHAVDTLGSHAPFVASRGQP